MHYKQSKVTGQDAFNKKSSTVVFPFASIAQYSNHLESIILLQTLTFAVCCPVQVLFLPMDTYFAAD